MRRFHYTLSWSPYGNSVLARNRKHAWRRILALWRPAGYTRRQLLKAVTIF